MTPIKFISEIRNRNDGIITRPHWKNLSNVIIFPTCCRENQRPELKPSKPETDVAALGTGWNFPLWKISGFFFCNCSWTDALSVQMHSLRSFLQLRRDLQGLVGIWVFPLPWISAIIAQKAIADKFLFFHACCLRSFKKTGSIKIKI